MSGWICRATSSDQRALPLACRTAALEAAAARTAANVFGSMHVCAPKRADDDATRGCEKEESKKRQVYVGFIVRRTKGQLR